MQKKYHSGFTLIELIIVITLLVVLVLLAIAYFRAQIFKGQDAKRKSDMHKILVAIEEYEKDHDCYPPPEAVVCNPGTGLQPYLEQIPCDPVSGASYYYDYEDKVCPSWYRIYTHLTTEGQGTNSGGGDVATTRCGPNGIFNFYLSSANAPVCTYTTNNAFYGCKNGQCVPIIWDVARPGPECDPNFQNSNCYNQCGSQAVECKRWD